MEKAAGIQRLYGGETGIRTLGARKGTTVFETAPIDHSGISPWGFCGAKVLFLFGLAKVFGTIFVKSGPGGRYFWIKCG